MRAALLRLAEQLEAEEERYRRRAEQYREDIAPSVSPVSYCLGRMDGARRKRAMVMAMAEVCGDDR